MSYRGAVYLPYEKCVRLNTWSDDGVRISYDFPYCPYLYVETTTTPYDALSIFNTKLRKCIFSTQGSRSKYVKENEGVRLFENLPPVQQFLIDKFYTQNDSPDFTKFPLKVWFLDIEAVSENEFPAADKAAYPINVLTMYDTLSDKYYIWGLHSFEHKQQNWHYFYFKCEKDMLEDFIKFVEKDPPDILSGWNINGFDIPYIINRITNILGGTFAQRLSPTKRITNRVFHNRFGKEQIKWTIDGIAVIDYLEIYKKFCQQMQESYKLGYIGEIELNESKVDYGEQNLYSLMKNNWQMFVEYNIQDVALLQKLEKKLKYLELVRMIAYAGCVPFESALGTLSIVNGLCAIKARNNEQRIHTFDRSDEEDIHLDGGFVADPVPGFQNAVVSFDANSLYPNTMISLNISPETKVGKVISRGSNYVEVQHVNNQTFTLTPEKFDIFLKQGKMSLSGSGVLFSQKKKGLVPEIVDTYHKMRSTTQAELSKLEKKKAQLVDIISEENKKEETNLKLKISRLNDKQQCIKILINAVFGYFGNKRAPMGDIDLASSITTTGQSIIKHARQSITDFISKESGCTDAEKNNNCIVAGDTDSVYISLKTVIAAKAIPLLKDGKISPEMLALVQTLGDYLDNSIKDFMLEKHNSLDPRIKFKRENICDTAFFLNKKKRYVLHILDSKGIACNKFKYTGVDVVRTTMPRPIKPYAKKLIETMILTQSKSEVDKLFLETYDVFKTLPIEDIATVKGISDYDKYASRCLDFTVCKRIPQHVKAAYFYNHLLKHLNIEKKYEKLGSGDKLRYFYVQKPNKFGLDVIGYKYRFPEEFKSILKPDYEMMFEKVLYAVLDRFYECVNWQIKDPSMVAQTDLFSLLS